MFGPTFATIQTPAERYHGTVGEIFSEIQQHMLEPVVNGGASWQLWEVNEVLNYLRERCSKFLTDTRLIQRRATVTTAADNAQYDIDPTASDLIRVAFDKQNLWPIDDWQLDSMGLAASGTPQYYKGSAEPQSAIELVPSPEDPGTLTYHYIPATPFEVPPSMAEEVVHYANYNLPFPWIFHWAVKYGTMADMLWKEGEAQDMERAAWCEQRYQDGVALVKIFLGAS